MTLTVRNEASGKKYKIVCDNGGGDARFFATLPSGTYRLVRWEKSGDSFNLSGSFDAGGGHAVYIGTMTWSRPRTVAGFFWGLLFGTTPGRLTVEDEYKESAPGFQERYPHLGQRIIKSIVHANGGGR